MSANRERSGGNLLTSGAFWCGVMFILAAPLMNFAYDRMSKRRLGGDGSEMLPSFLAQLYDGGGKVTVTLTLVGIGIAILIYAYVRNSKKSTLVVLPKRQNVESQESADGGSSQGPEMTASGHMVLQTRKYLS